jgi:tetratricopeptide (TPR) repeat protein
MTAPPGSEPTASGTRAVAASQNNGVVQTGDNASTHIHADQVIFRVVPPVLDQLPAAELSFTGRDHELALLAEALDPVAAVGAALVSAVAGIPGVGKTALAVQAGHTARRRGWYPGGILFIDLHGYDDQPIQPGQALDALLRALRVPADDIPPSTDERAALYRSTLAGVGEPILVLADNASSEAQVRPLIPGVGPHRVLLTSRDTLADLPARLVEVTKLGEDAAVVLLDTALRAARPGDDRITADPTGAHLLARSCAGLPLALQICASVLKADPVLGVSELAGELAVESTRLDRLAYDDGSGPASLSVAAAFALSYRRLDVVAARVFRLMSVSPGPDISTAAAVALVDMPSAQTRALLGVLARAHLAEAAPGPPGRWRMHDLLRLYARQLSDQHAEGDGREQATDRVLGYYVEMARAADDHLRALSGTLVPAQFAGRDDALTWLDGERIALTAAVTLAAATGRDQITMRLPSSLTRYLSWRRRTADYLNMAEISLDAARRLGDRASEAVCLTVVAAALGGVRRFEDAIMACQAAAVIYRETGNRRGQAIALTNLGLALSEVRRFEEAITAHRDAAAIFRETGDRHGQGIELGNLGIALAKVRRFEEAVTACRTAAEIYQEVGDRYGEAIALTNLSATLVEVRRFEEVIAVQEQASVICRETGDRHGEAMGISNVGLALAGMRRFEEAITAFQNSIVIYREANDRHGEATAINNLGATLTRMRQYAGAITAHEGAIVIYQETGDRHGEASALNNLGLALDGVRRFGEAITAHERAAVIYRETGDRHGEASALTNLGLALSGVRQFGKAIASHEGAIVIYEETGDRHGSATALANLGSAMIDARRLDEAITVCQDAVKAYRETGDRHGEAVALGPLGAALWEAGRHEEAIMIFQDAAKIYRETLDRHGEATMIQNLTQVRTAI